MGPRFDDFVPFFKGPGVDDKGNPTTIDHVVAVGPLHEGDHVEELCAWIYQPGETERTKDTAATEMTTNFDAGGGNAVFRQAAGSRWLLPLKRLDEGGAEFRPGRAFAVAVALVTDQSDATHPGPRVVWWGQPITLFEDEARTQASLTLPAGALDHPDFMEGASSPRAA